MWEEIINKLEVRSLFLYPSWNQGLRQAAEKARASLSSFRLALIASRKMQAHFSVNVVFPGLLKDEHVWLEEVREEDGKFVGVVGHAPRMTKAVKLGQLWAASPETICDWMYVDNGKLVGGYTLRELYSRMSEEDQLAFDRAVPFVVVDEQEANAPVNQFLNAIGNEDVGLVEAFLKQTPEIAREIGKVGVKGGAASQVDVSETTGLLYAADLGDLGIVKRFLDHGLNPDQADPYGNTPLMAACGLGRLDMAKQLVKFGANPNLGNIAGLTPLFVAAWNETPDCVEYLLSVGADIAHLANNGTGVLFQVKSLSVAESLVKAGASFNYKEKVLGWTPLRSWVADGHVELAIYLIECGAEADEEAMNAAVKSFSAEDFERFKKRVGKPWSKKKRESNIPSIAEDDDIEPGREVVTQRSVEEPDVEMLAATEQARAEVARFRQALQQPKRAQTGFAVKMTVIDGEAEDELWLDSVGYTDGKFVGRVRCESEIIQSILVGEEFAVEEKDILDWMYTDNLKLVGGYTLRVLRSRMNRDELFDANYESPYVVLEEKVMVEPVSCFLDAIGNGEMETVQALLKEHPDWVDALGMAVFSVLGETVMAGECFPLMYAARIGDLAMVKYLLEAGANPNQVGDAEITALHEACSTGDTEIVKALLSAGANPNAKDIADQTPLLAAVSKERLACIDELVEAGADVNQRLDEGDTLLHIVQSAHCIERLLAAGADLEAEDENKWTPLRQAVEEGRTEVALSLIAAGAVVADLDAFLKVVRCCLGDKTALQIEQAVKARP